MSYMPGRAEAWAVLRQYNKNEFHLRHALTEESVMRWFAVKLRYEPEADFWALTGLLHDLDFERWPEEHCRKTEIIMRELNWDERLIHAVVSHGYGIVTDVRPEHEMEKVLFATDELTGLIGAAAIVRPSRSVADLELKSVKKKFKTASFAAGCSRSVIEQGAAMLGWETDTLIERTILAMRAGEADVNASMPARN
jgi:predicted hydrolase (HD superfamily)